MLSSHLSNRSGVLVSPPGECIPGSRARTRRLAPLWHRVGGLIFRHADDFYNFEGLRHYKEKFAPVWRPHYLASPGGLALPRVILDSSILISGGLTKIVSR